MTKPRCAPSSRARKGTEHVIAACDEVAHIPIRSESLNAGMAATVALYELDRRIRGHA